MPLSALFTSLLLFAAMPLCSHAQSLDSGGSMTVIEHYPAVLGLAAARP